MFSNSKVSPTFSSIDKIDEDNDTPSKLDDDSASELPAKNVIERSNSILRKNGDSSIFRSSRRKGTKLKAPRLIFRNHKSAVLRVTSMNNYDRNIGDVKDTLLISGGDDKCIFINSLQFGTTVMRLTGHEQRVSGLATYSGVGYPSCVISSSWDETIKIWNVDNCFSFRSTERMIHVDQAWKTLNGHSNRICCVKVITVNQQSETYPLIASGSTDGSIKLWNFKKLGDKEFNTDCLFTIFDEFNITWYLCLEFCHSPDEGHLLISGSKDNFVRVWSLEDILAGKRVEGTSTTPTRIIHGHLSKIINVSVTTELEDGVQVTRILTTCHDLCVRFFSLDGKLLRSLNEIPSVIASMDVHDSLRDGCDIILTTGQNGNIRVWRSLTGELLHVFKGYVGACTCTIAIPSPDVAGDIVVFSGGADGSSRLFLYSVEKSLRVLNHLHIEDGVRPVKVNVVKSITQEDMVSPLVFGGCNDGTIWCWLLNEGENEAVVKFNEAIHSARVRALAVYSPPAHSITTIEEEDERDDELENKANVGIAFTPVSSNEARKASRYDIDLTSPLLVSSGRDRTIVITLIDSGRPIAKIEEADRLAITSLDLYTQKGNIEPFIVCGSESNNACVYSFQHGNLLHVLEGHQFDVTSVKVYIPKPKKPKKVGGTNASAASSRSASRSNSARGQAPLTLTHTHALPSNPVIFTSSMDNTVMTWVYDNATNSFIQDAVLSDSPSYISCLDICHLDDCDVLAAGNGDGDVFLWKIENHMALDQREIEYVLVNVFTGYHSDEIFGVSMYNPEGLPPILVSGSGDNTLVLWNLETYKYIQRIEGHDGDVTSVDLFAPGCYDPMLASASIDGSIRVISDFLGNLPKADAVALAYKLDENDRSGKWSRILYLVEKFKAESFFQLFYSLFFQSLESGRHEFLELFLPMSIKALIKSNAPLRHEMHNYSNDCELKSLLRLAMEKANNAAVTVIVSCWIKFFTRNLHDWTGDLIYDEKSNISMEDLLMLSDLYPDEFIRLICEITPIPLEKNRLDEGLYYLDIDNDGDMELVKHVSTSHLAVAEEEEGKKAGNHDEFTFLSLPVQNLCHISLMKAYVAVCLKTDDARLFDSDVGILTLAYCWRLYGRNYHIYSMKIYLFYVLVSSLSLFVFKSTKDQGFLRLVTLFMIILQLFLTLYLFSKEIRQLYKEKFAYFHDAWNLTDTVNTVCSIVGNVLRLAHWDETDASRFFLSLAITIIYFKVLFYLRAFETSGPLVSMIIQIWNDMQSLLGIIGLVVIGFSQSFWLLSEKDSSLAFSSIPDSFLNSYSFMLGGYDPTAFDGASLESWATFLSVVYMLLMNLLLLNLLIALMGNSYTVVQEKGNAQWRLEQTQVVLDHASQLRDEVKTHTMVYVRKRTEVLKRLNQEKSEKVDVVGEVRCVVNGLAERVDDLTARLDILIKSSMHA